MHMIDENGNKVQINAYEEEDIATEFDDIDISGILGAAVDTNELAGYSESDGEYQDIDFDDDIIEDDDIIGSDDN